MASSIDPALILAIEAQHRTIAPAAARLRRWHLTARLAAVSVGVWSAVVMVAWIADAPAWTTLHGQLPPMTFGEAVCFFTLGVAVCLAPVFPNRSSRLIRVLSATTVISIVVLSDIGRATGAPRPMGQLLGLGTDGSSLRIPILVGLGLIALSVAWAVQPRFVLLSQQIALVSVGFTVFLLNGYLFDPDALISTTPFQKISLSTALCAFALSLALIALNAGQGIARLLTEESVGGDLVRRLLPAAVLAQAVAAGLAYGLHTQGLVQSGFALAVASSLSMVLVATLVWHQARMLRDVDVRRVGAEDVIEQVRGALAQRDQLAARLQSSELRLREIISSSADAYISISPERAIREWNPQATAIFGWSADEALGHDLAGLIVPDRLRNKFADDMVDYLATGEGPIFGLPLEFAALRKDGTEFPLEIRIWPVGTNHDRSFHAFARDISARKRAETELLRANRELEEFAAVAAHDLRSPLAAIQLSATLIEEHLDDQPAEQIIDWTRRIRQAAHRGDDLIADLLSFAVLSRAATEPMDVDLAAMAHDVADEAAAAAGRPSRITIGVLPHVTGDPVLLRQLLSNLIGNGLKYVAAGSLPEVSVEAVDSKPRYARIAVTDNGPGIPDDDLDRVFDIFVRGGNSKETPGTGIGLAICRRVVEQHGGTLVVHNLPSGGCRFSFTLRW